jgi:UDP-N-acetylmuramoyl-L-alanyl-D-glutamate--2,6-diaminopimelate ligase
LIINNVFLPIFGEFNISNCLSIICVLLTENIKIEDIILLISKIKPVSGRMEMISIDNFPNIIIDYAHTPDALKNILLNLQYLKKLLRGKLWCIFGCGGNRDTTKRPIMGKIANKNSDYIIITNDNPRFEDENEIITMILLGINTEIENKEIKIINDRKLAIEYVINSAKPNDIILIAGKGHETTQEIKGIKYYCSDKEYVNNIINLKQL